MTQGILFLDLLKTHPDFETPFKPRSERDSLIHGYHLNTASMILICILIQVFPMLLLVLPDIWVPQCGGGSQTFPE